MASKKSSSNSSNGSSNGSHAGSNQSNTTKPSSAPSLISKKSKTSPPPQQQKASTPSLTNTSSSKTVKSGAWASVIKGTTPSRSKSKSPVPTPPPLKPATPVESPVLKSEPPMTDSIPNTTTKQEYIPINEFNSEVLSNFLQTRFNDQTGKLGKKHYYKPININNWNVSINGKNKLNVNNVHGNLKKFNSDSIDILMELNKNR